MPPSLLEPGRGKRHTNVCIQVVLQVEVVHTNSAFSGLVFCVCLWQVQAVTFLVIHQKHKKSLEEITNDLCPVLSVQQLYRIRYTNSSVARHMCNCLCICGMCASLLRLVEL